MLSVTHHDVLAIPAGWLWDPDLQEALHTHELQVWIVGTRADVYLLGVWEGKMVMTDRNTGISRINDLPTVGIQSLGSPCRTAIMPIQYLEPVRPMKGKKAFVVSGSNKGHTGMITRAEGRSIVLKTPEGPQFKDVIDHVVMLA